MKNILKLFNMRIFLYAFLIWINLNITGISSTYITSRITKTAIVVKILHLFFLYLIISKIVSLYKEKHTQKGKNEIAISLIYFIILMSLLILIWPGAWSWDDITILKNAKTYNLTPWHHFFSGLFQILCLQTIPIPSGVIIIQIIISSLIVGYCITNISRLYGKSEKQVKIIQLFCILITLLPPVIMHILTGFRMGLYTYLELLLITKMIILYKEKKQASFKDIINISFLTFIISSWRTEGIYYPFLILILYFILGKRVIKKKVAITSFIIIMIFNYSVGKVNNFLIGSNNYSITATMEPVTSIVKISDESDEKEVEAINKVIDVKYVLDNPNFSGETYYWTTGVVKQYSEEDYVEYLKAYIKLSLKYPYVTLNSMWNMFVKTGSGGVHGSQQTTRNMINGAGNTLKLYDLENASSWKWNAVNSRFKQPINLNIRNTVIRFMSGTNLDGRLTIIHNILWNLFIPFTLILICLIYKLINKDWGMTFLILTVITRIPLVFITAPAPYFMYYLSTYLCSYVISFLVIFEYIINSKKRENDKNIKELIVFKERKIYVVKKIFKQFLSFLLVSGVGWIIDFSIFYILTHLGKLRVVYANILSSIPAITYVFMMSNKKIFKNTNSKLSIKMKYLVYFGYQLILLLSVSIFGELLYAKLINIITVSLILNNLKIVIKVLITPITMIMNFIVMKNLIEKL